jgi:DNA-binding transcriptional LysR family regulator
MPSPLKLRHLEVFLAVANAGSMQSAARTIRLTQPAISKMIGELEAIFGVPLMNRSRRGVALTECGAALLDRARLTLNEFATTADELRAIAQGTVGKVRVGVLPVVESVILPQTLLALRKNAPGLSVQVEEGTRAVLINALWRGEVDCVIGRLDPEDERHFHVEPLKRMPVTLVAAPSHPLTRKKRVTWKDVAQYPWVLPQANAPIRRAIESHFIRAGLRPPIPKIESTSSRLNAAIVSATDMIAIMTEDAALGYRKAGTLAILPVTPIGPLSEVGIITRSQHLSYAMRPFLAALRLQCAAPDSIPAKARRASNKR